MGVRINIHYEKCKQRKKGSMINSTWLIVISADSLTEHTRCTYTDRHTRCTYTHRTYTVHTHSQNIHGAHTLTEHTWCTHTHNHTKKRIISVLTPSSHWQDLSSTTADALNRQKDFQALRDGWKAMPHLSELYLETPQRMKGAPLSHIDPDPYVFWPSIWLVEALLPIGFLLLIQWTCVVFVCGSLP